MRARRVLMLSVGLGLGASFAFGFADFFGGLKSRTFDVLPVIAISQVTGLSALTIIVVLTGSQRGDMLATALAIGAGALGTIAVFAFYRGMVLGAISVVSAVTAVAPIIPVAVGLAAGERLNAQQGLGIALALGGITLVSLPRAGEFGRRLGAGVPTALVAATALGLFLTTLGVASEETPLWASLVQRAVTTALVVAIVVVSRRPLPRRIVDLASIGAIGLADTAGSVSFALASAVGFLAIAAVMASLYPVVTIFLAHVLLGERLTRRQWVGVGAVMSGVMTVTSG